VAEFRENSAQATLESGSSDETTAKKVMTKKGRQFFKGKIGDTVSCRPG